MSFEEAIAAYINDFAQADLLIQIQNGLGFIAILVCLYLFFRFFYVVTTGKPVKVDVIGFKRLNRFWYVIPVPVYYPFVRYKTEKGKTKEALLNTAELNLDDFKTITVFQCKDSIRFASFHKLGCALFAFSLIGFFLSIVFLPDQQSLSFWICTLMMVFSIVVMLCHRFSFERNYKSNPFMIVFAKSKRDEEILETKMTDEDYQKLKNSNAILSYEQAVCMHEKEKTPIVFVILIAISVYLIWAFLL